MKVLNEVNFTIYEVLITLDILDIGLESAFRDKRLYTSSYPLSKLKNGIMTIHVFQWLECDESLKLVQLNFKTDYSSRVEYQQSDCHGEELKMTANSIETALNLYPCFKDLLKQCKREKAIDRLIE